LLVALVLAVAACGALKEGIEDSNRATAGLKSELGVDAQISFKTTNGRTTVTVRLLKPPVGDAAAVKTRITDIVTRNFRTTVEHVEVAF
jgi:hypothetical protein